MKKIDNYFDGKLQTGSSGKYLNVDDPSTGEVISQVILSNQNEYNQIVSSSINAFKEWSQTTPFERSTRLHTLANNMEQNLEQLATIISLENGKPFAGLV